MSAITPDGLALRRPLGDVEGEPAPDDRIARRRAEAARSRPDRSPVEITRARLNPGQTMDERAAGKNPMGRIGRMHELQRLAAFLMADGCEWLIRQTIALDGAGHLAGAGTFYGLRSWTDDDWKRAREMIKAQNDKDRSQRSG